MNTTVLATFENTEDAIKVYVAAVRNGYSVAVQDMDSEEFVGVALIFQTEAAAIEKAKAVVAGQA